MRKEPAGFVDRLAKPHGHEFELRDEPLEHVCGEGSKKLVLERTVRTWHGGTLSVSGRFFIRSISNIWMEMTVDSYVRWPAKRHTVGSWTAARCHAEATKRALAIRTQGGRELCSFSNIREARRGSRCE